MWPHYLQELSFGRQLNQPIVGAARLGSLGQLSFRYCAPRPIHHGLPYNSFQVQPAHHRISFGRVLCAAGCRSGPSSTSPSPRSCGQPTFGRCQSALSLTSPSPELCVQLPYSSCRWDIFITIPSYRCHCNVCLWAITPSCVAALPPAAIVREWLQSSHHRIDVASFAPAPIIWALLQPVCHRDCFAGFPGAVVVREVRQPVHHPWANFTRQLLFGGKFNQPVNGALSATSLRQLSFGHTYSTSPLTVIWVCIVL